MPKKPIDNSALAELLALAADKAKQPLQKALRRASRKAYLWQEEAADLLKAGRSLQELDAVGPTISRIIRELVENPPRVPEPPPIRKHFLTWSQSQKVLEKKPAWTRDLKGDLQMHTRWSDGEGTIQEMAEAAVERGYEYIAITDHAKSLKIAGGMDEAAVRKQGREIGEVNDQLQQAGNRLRVLRSIELNLDPQGRGDMDERCLQELDLVLGCFHSALRRKEDQTQRYVSALRNSAVQILGHPRGRIYNYRVGLHADWPRVFAVAAELDKAVEIDGYPDRQDLSGDLLKLAKSAGCRISLGTDSHGPSQFRFMTYSLASAISAGIPRDKILNFMTRDELLDWANDVRERSLRME